MSLALYRRYRPETFEEVIGQEHVTGPLQQALRNQRINHAYLFSGPRGCGKTTSARILARCLNCEQGPTPTPCGQCKSCVGLARGASGSIDVIEIDAASHGGVDDARDLRERAFFAPVESRYKIYILDEAHMVSSAGFNALLKVVEEPPPHLKFIFATTEPDKVIPTIRSRTHHYPFRLMPPSVMRDLTEEILGSEHVQFDPAVLPLVVRAGGGSARDTLSILDQLLAGSDEAGIRYDRAVALLGYTDASLIDEIVDAFAAANGAAVFRAVNRVIEGGHEPRRFGTDMLDRFRDLIVLASVPDAISTGLLDVPPDRAEALRGQAERHGLVSLTRAADIIATGLDQMRGATSPRLLLELMCAQVLLPAAATDERSLLARIERLESGAATARVPVAVGTGNEYPERERPTPRPHPSADSGAAPVAAQSAPPAPNAGQPATHPARPEGQPAQSSQAPVASQPPQPPQAPVASQAPAASQPGGYGQSGEAQRQAPAQAGAPQRPAAAFTHAPGAQGVPTAPDVPRGTVTVDVLRQTWPNVIEAVKAKGRVPWMLVRNANVASFDEGVLTLRFLRQGDVKGFQGTRYEDVLKQVLNAMFGINVVIRAITGGGDAPSPGRRPGPGPGPAAPTAPYGQTSPSYGQPPAGQPPATPPGDYPQPPSGQSYAPGPVAPGSGASNGRGEDTNSFGSPGMSGDGDSLPLPPPPPPDDEDFDPDDEDMSSSTTVNDLTGMALVQRELGAQIIAEYDD